MSNKQESKILFICNECKFEKFASDEFLLKQSSENEEMVDIPIHCDKEMGFTIKMVDIIETYVSSQEIDIDSLKWYLLDTVNNYIRKHAFANISEINEEFEKVLDKKYNEFGETMNLTKIQQLTIAFRKTTNEVIGEGDHYDRLQIWAATILKSYSDRMNKKNDLKIRETEGPVMPGTISNMDINYFCTECKELFEIPSEIKKQLLQSSSSPIMSLPDHHGKEMEIRIKQAVQEEKKIEKKKKEDVNLNLISENIQQIKVVSIGIDIGSSTSHLVFSRLTLQKETGFFNMTNRFNLIDREILYEGSIIDTPLLDTNTIDIDSIVSFCKDEFENAGFKPSQIDTGAVIVTGETAKKGNASEIVERLSSESGKFVSAVAGPNYESLLGAMGSGMVNRSLENQNTVMNVDIGGGTSNIAIISNGQVLSTSCINVGGRLLGINNENRIWRIDEPTKFIMNELDMNYQINDIIALDEIDKIVNKYAVALVEVMMGRAESRIAKYLMMTDDLDFSYNIDEYSFSGGVGELIYNKGISSYNDIGRLLAKQLAQMLTDQNISIVEPENKIRATVIGAGAFSLSVSGSTTYVDKSINFPLNNIPVIPVNIQKENFSGENLHKEINNSFRKYDMKEGDDRVALYFKDPFYQKDSLLPVFAQNIERIMKNTIINGIELIIIFANDMAHLVGIAFRDHTKVRSKLICLDELTLQDGDWIDIGSPLEGASFPITVKSLVFNQNKDSK